MRIQQIKNLDLKKQMAQKHTTIMQEKLDSNLLFPGSKTSGHPSASQSDLQSLLRLSVPKGEA